MEQRNLESRRIPWRAIIWTLIVIALVAASAWVLSAGKNAYAITNQQAIAAALADAGVSESDTTALRCKVDTDDRVPHYEVEFTVNGTEYDYDIHAKTGEILSRDVDYRETSAAASVQETKPETKADTAQTPASQGSTTTQGSTSTPPTDRLSPEEALSIAYADAGVTADQARDIECELDCEKGQWVYEISFDVGRTEYEFDLDAVTGAILTREIDQ